MKKAKKTLFLLSTVSVVLIVLIFSGWLYYTQQSKQTKSKTGLTINLKDDKSYPKVENYTVPVLMYHYIRDASGEDELGQKLSVSPKNFAAQMAWLKDNDFQAIHLEDLADMDRVELSRVNGEGYKPIIITFDDGYDDAFTNAYNILKQYGFTGTFFVITKSLDKPGYLTTEQVNALRKAGNEIGSHTVSHPDLTDLDSASVRKQLVESKDDTKVFCYPSGRYNDRVRDLVKETGYVAAVTTKSGVVTEDSKLYDLPRIRINNISAEQFGDVIEHALEPNE